MSHTYVVGLTGGIGSGKSAVATAFAELGIEVADADAAAHAVTAAGESGHTAVVAAFGDRALRPDGELDRAWLRATIFAEPAARQRLEQVLHPLIHARLATEMAAWQGPYGIVAVPLLLESGHLLPKVDRVLVVDCSEDEQIRRVNARSGLPQGEIRAIMAAQWRRTARLARADDVVDNSGAPEDIGPQVLRLDAMYRDMAARKRVAGGAGNPQNGARSAEVRNP